MGTMDSIEKSLLSNVEDMFSHAKALIHENLYDLNRDHYSGYMWIACLDFRTCLACGSLDGKIFPALPGEEGGPPEQPVHPHCRCVIVPVLQGMEDDYKAPNYQEWLARQPVERQIDVLGPSKFVLYKKGQSVERFVKDGRAMTLDELGALRTSREQILYSKTRNVLEFDEVPNNDDEIRKVLVDKMMSRGIPSDFNESSRETIEYIPEIHDKVSKDFPDIFKYITRLYWENDISDDHGAGYNPVKMELIYNRRIFNSKDNLLAYINQVKGNFASTDIKGQIAHEYGHVIERLITGLEDKKTDAVYRRVKQTLLDNGIKSWQSVESNLSICAGRDHAYNEVIAEAVSDYLTGQNTRKVSVDIYNVLIKLYKEL